jgi:hypothetical protein
MNPGYFNGNLINEYSSGVVIKDAGKFKNSKTLQFCGSFFMLQPSFDYLPLLLHYTVNPMPS